MTVDTQTHHVLPTAMATRPAPLSGNRQIG
jgi:hypothetical protein